MATKEKVRYQPTETQKEMMYDALNFIGRARNLLRDLATTKMPQWLEGRVIGASADCSTAMQRFKEIVPKSKMQMFQEQIIESDPFVLENIMTMLRCMTPESQAAIEQVCIAVRKGATVEVKLDTTDENS